MKKLSIVLLLLCCLILPMKVYAEDDNSNQGDTTTIVDEETPEKAAKKSRDNMYIPLLAVTFGVLGIYGYSLSKKREEVNLQVNSAYRNDDGSFTVSLGYKNPKKEKIHIETNKVNVTHGTAIILKNEDIDALEPGKHEDVITAVINEDTNLNWNINEKSISIDGNKILKKGR